jgi:hypothetical protein
MWRIFSLVCSHDLPRTSPWLSLPEAAAWSSFDHHELVQVERQANDVHVLATSASAGANEPLLVEKSLDCRTKPFASIQPHFQSPVDAPPLTPLYGLIGDNVWKPVSQTAAQLSERLSFTIQLVGGEFRITSTSLFD